MKAFITTVGVRYTIAHNIEIREVDGEETDTVQTGKSFIVQSGDAKWYYSNEGKDWHRTRAAAIKQAEKMRKDQITDLKKQIKRLEALTF